MVNEYGKSIIVISHGLEMPAAFRIAWQVPVRTCFGHDDRSGSPRPTRFAVIANRSFLPHQAEAVRLQQADEFVKGQRWLPQVQIISDTVATEVGAPFISRSSLSTKYCFATARN